MKPVLRLNSTRVDLERLAVLDRALISSTHDIYDLCKRAWGPFDARTVIALESYMGALDRAARRMVAA